MLAPESQSEYAEGAGHAAEAAFPPFDPTYFASQLFWLAISFIVLYVLLSRFVLPRIGGAIEERPQHRSMMMCCLVLDRVA